MSDPRAPDYWTHIPQTSPDTPGPALHVAVIEDVIPLDAQFGVEQPQTVPEALMDPLFGRVAPRNDPGDAPLWTYAILDGAKVPNLPELLEASDLEHRCLFKGAAFEDLKDVAPWIVRLEPDHAFTRNLFTRSDAPWHLWDREPGIYLRAHAPLEAMWRHFRKFTKIQDDVGRWYYMRFWDPGFLKELAMMQDNALAQQILDPVYASRSLFWHQKQMVRITSLTNRISPGRPIRLNATTWGVLERYAKDQYLRRLKQACLEHQGMTDDKVDQMITFFLSKDIKSRSVLRALMLWCCTADGWAAATSHVFKDELENSRGRPDAVRAARLYNMFPGSDPSVVST